MVRYFARNEKSRTIHRANVRKGTSDVRLWCGPILEESGETSEEGFPLLRRKVKRTARDRFALISGIPLGQESQRRAAGYANDCRTCF